ncbi:unnamed protein product [Dovyalis caffra]|uniref:Uncharacterized protein n=1 Tax=Dovyalis caffra TaxID=77055 RepID=A0AAV1RFJ9_9ROSI|nr:unnamed protein product [Dovyalis caffra]
MVGAETLSLASSLIFKATNKLIHPSVLSHPSKLSFPFQSFSVSCLSLPYRIPTNAIFICHGKMDGEVADEIDEFFFDDNYGTMIEEEEMSDEDETESSMDLLIRFLQSMFKKLSKRAKKASRSMLPAVISPQLVSFAVDGILLLAALSIVKALLEVVCTLGSTVFVVILLLRVVWAAISYFQSSENTSNQGGSSFGTTQPVA